MSVFRNAQDYLNWRAGVPSGRRKSFAMMSKAERMKLHQRRDHLEREASSAAYAKRARAEVLAANDGIRPVDAGVFDAYRRDLEYRASHNLLAPEELEAMRAALQIAGPPEDESTE